MKATRSGKNRNYSGNKAFAGLGKTVFFVCMLAVFVFFSHAGPLGAHESDSHDATITAGEVDVTSEESVKAFLLHVKAHWDEIPTGGVTPLISFKNDLSVDGDWRNGTTYTMRLGEGGALVHHPYYPLTQNGILDNDQTSVQDLIAAAEADTQGGCIPYTLDGVDRWSCAAKIEHPVYRGQTPPVEEILVVGLHHDFEDVSFANIRCPYYVPEISAIKRSGQRYDESIRNRIRRLLCNTGESYRKRDSTPELLESTALEIRGHLPVCHDRWRVRGL